MSPVESYRPCVLPNAASMLAHRLRRLRPVESYRPCVLPKAAMCITQCCFNVGPPSLTLAQH